MRLLFRANREKGTISKSAYVLKRCIASVLGRLFGIQDEDIPVGMSEMHPENHQDPENYD